jgi:hypothetical protein
VYIYKLGIEHQWDNGNIKQIDMSKWLITLVSSTIYRWYHPLRRQLLFIFAEYWGVEPADVKINLG